MKVTFPGYHIVFVENPPRELKKKEPFSWVLKLPTDEFPSEDSLHSQAFIPLSHTSANHPTRPLSPYEAHTPSSEELLSFGEEPLAPFVSCLSDADMAKALEETLAETLEEPELLDALDESQLPEAELLGEVEADEIEEAAVQLEAKAAPSFHFRFHHSHLKLKPRIQRMAPEFVSQAHEYSGPLLEEVRCFHGMTLGELADATRVAQHHLQNIECEQYDRLPATVYLRGYLKSVARELGLDVQLVAQSYLERMQQAKS